MESGFFSAPLKNDNAKKAGTIIYFNRIL